MESTKLEQLADVEGFESTDEMIAAAMTDAVCPGICVNCDYTIHVEPDCTDGWCEICESNSVKSCLILAEMI